MCPPDAAGANTQVRPYMVPFSSARVDKTSRETKVNGMGVP